MLMHLIYASKPFGYDDLALTNILSVARANNSRDDITGSLICREDIYLQLLEGPSEAVMQTYSRIRRDDRHTEVTTLVSNPTASRLFPDWAMRHDPARSLMWSVSEVRDGAVVRASQSDIIGVFERLARDPTPAAQA